MKYYITSLVLFFCLVSHSQFDILWDDDPGNIYNYQTINISKDYGGFDVYMHCQNTSMASQEIKFGRIVLSSFSSFSDQFCDNNLCFPVFGNDWISPSSSIISAGDSSIMKPTFNFQTEEEQHLLGIMYWMFPNNLSIQLMLVLHARLELMKMIFQLQLTQILHRNQF